MLIAVAISTGACATAGRAPVTLLSPTVTVVAGVAMLAPSEAPAVTYDAVQVEPERAPIIAAFAVAAAPHQAEQIIAAARASAPHMAQEIDAATKRLVRRRVPVVLASIPDHGYLVRLVDRATSAR